MTSGALFIFKEHVSMIENCKCLTIKMFITGNTCHAKVSIRLNKKCLYLCDHSLLDY